MAKEMYQVTFRILESDDERFYDRFNNHWELNGIELSPQTLEKVYSKNARIILNQVK